MHYCLILLLALSCAPKVQTTAQLPACVQQRIDALKAAPKANPAAEVQEYVYKGKTVYLFNAPCCDQYSVALDGDCNSVCAPYGGMTGEGDRRCPDFTDSARSVRLVWRDER